MRVHQGEEYFEICEKTRLAMCWQLLKDKIQMIDYYVCNRMGTNRWVDGRHSTATSEKDAVESC